MGEFEKHIDADYLRRAAEAMQVVKRLTYALMGLPARSRVLDVGCGPGVDLPPMVAAMPAGGRATGVDVSEQMLAEATALLRAHGLEERVELLRASALELPFEDGAFDAVRAERLFQVLDPAVFPPSDLLAELLRVLRPSGRIVLADTDWASASVDFPDLNLERRLLDFFARRCRPNGFAARQFRGWLVDQGLRDVELHVTPMPMFSRENCPLHTWLAEEALRQGAATADEARRWLGVLDERHERGTFYACVNMLVVAGTKME